MAEGGGTFSGNGRDRREASGPLELAYLNLVKLKPATMVNGRYRLVRLIGQGGFGIVFEALDETLGARVALKFLNPRLTRNERKFLRVRREINLSRRISDERIVKVFSLESWREIRFLVMELAAGRSLASLLDEKCQLAWPEFRDVFLDIAEAVAVLHQGGIVHRDLKPGNILIDDRGRVKILDFGLAKEIDDEEKTSTAGEVVGSPYYMSPEQIRCQEVGAASDVYQLGLVLYRALAGCHPFEHPSTMEVIFKHLHQRPAPPDPSVSGLPPFLRHGLEKALEKSPAMRFRDAGAMAAFFRRGKVSWPQRLLAAFRRGPLRWALATVLVSALAFTGFQATFGSRRPHSLRQDGGRLEARNRFGVRLWRRDFTPLVVLNSFLTPNRFPIPKGQEITKNYLRIDPDGAPAAVAHLAPAANPIFPMDQSIASDSLLCQRAVIGADGQLLLQEPLVADGEFDPYDYVKVVKPHTFQVLGTAADGEVETLFSVQQYQSMYPFAMVYGRGLRKRIFTHPGTFLTVPLEHGRERDSFMLFGINNLFAHMSFVAEIAFDATGDYVQLTRGIPNLNPDMRNNVPHEERLYILPFRARLLENRWQQEGRARFGEETQGDIVEIDREGRLAVQTKNGRRLYHDARDTLRRVYTLVNLSYQERMVKRNARNALALIEQACAFPLQNPYLRSALLWMQGDLQIENGDYRSGERSLQRALELFSGNNDACERLCEMEMLRNDVPAALRRLDDSRTDSSQFWGFSSFGVSLFRGYLHLHAGLFSQADIEFAKIRRRVADIGVHVSAAADLFQGRYGKAAEALLALERKPLGNVDVRELRLLLGRALLLNDADLARARFLFVDIGRNSLEFGHLAEISTYYLLARSGQAAEAARSAREAFARLRQQARGDFMTRLWLFYDAYIYGMTMELAGDRGEAARGYRASIEANPNTELAARSRRRLGQAAE